jgi:hypothetical protein
MLQIVDAWNLTGGATVIICGEQYSEDIFSAYSFLKWTFWEVIIIFFPLNVVQGIKDILKYMHNHFHFVALCRLLRILMHNSVLETFEASPCAHVTMKCHEGANAMLYLPV